MNGEAGRGKVGREMILPTSASYITKVTIPSQCSVTIL